MTPTLSPIARRIPLWIDLRGVPINKRLSYLKAVADAAVDAVLLAKGDPHGTRAGLATVLVGADGQLRKGGRRIGRMLGVHDAASQAKAAQAKGVVVVDAKSWRVIPLENLIAARRDRPGTLFALARGPEQAALFANTLETGVHGIALVPNGVADIRATADLLRRAATTRAAAQIATPSGKSATKRSSRQPSPTRRSQTQPHRLQLHPATITNVENAGMGDRVCIDTTSLLREGEGLLVGSTARSFVLVHAETVESKFIRARPFRINAGALHMYVLAPDGKTRYLSELAAGDQALAVHRSATQRIVTIGRAKIERRPHTLVRWTSPGGDGMAVLQTAETIRLVRPDGSLVAVTDLKAKDEVLVHHETVARHFGMPVDAHLEER